jgi:hypothetical protein
MFKNKDFYIGIVFVKKSATSPSMTKSFDRHCLQYIVLKTDIIYLPVVFCLLVNKSTDTYVNAFNHIKLKCIELKLTVNPKSITIDFEQAIHDAVSIACLNILIVGCSFHLTQSWFRKISSLS